MLLTIDNLSVYYGQVVALRGITMRMREDSTVAIIGANGAGKTTLLRAISGLNHAREGQIVYNARRIDALPAEEIIGLGVAHAPEGRRVFADLTVDENLRLGAYLRRDKDGIARDLESIYTHFPRLKERVKQSAKTMSGGEQQMLAIGRALMSSPRLLLLDEPSMGLSPVMVEEIQAIINEVRAQKISVILVEQNAEMALQMADYAYVLETGRVILEGAGAELQANEDVRRAYLGG